MTEDFRHRYDKWSKNNLIIEIERLKRRVHQLEGLDPESLEIIRKQRQKQVMAEARRKALAMQKVEQLPDPSQQREEYDLVPKDMGGGITIMVPPGTE